MNKKDRMNDRERPRYRRGVDVVATNVTAATVPKPGDSSSRPVLEEKIRKERELISVLERQKVKKRGEREKSERDRERPENGAESMSLPPMSPPQPCQNWA